MLRANLKYLVIVFKIDVNLTSNLNTCFGRIVFIKNRSQKRDQIKFMLQNITNEGQQDATSYDAIQP